MISVHLFFSAESASWSFLIYDILFVRLLKSQKRTSDKANQTSELANQTSEEEVQTSEKEVQTSEEVIQLSEEVIQMSEEGGLLSESVNHSFLVSFNR